MGAQNDAVYVFDLDGVITDPADSSVDEVVVGHIADILDQGGHIAVNTGRSFVWVEENLVKRLATKSTAAFDRLYIVCEKGGESRIWRDGEFVSQASRFALPSAITAIVRDAYQQNYDSLNTMFWDATKQTMATVEKYPEADLESFHRQQAQLDRLLHEALTGKDVKIDSTTIATDVESPQAGKHAGAELIYEWVASHTAVDHDTFTCFGDSVSDYEMARYFAEQGAKTMFVYVGKPAKIDEDSRVNLMTTKAHYAAGTKEFLRAL